MHHRFGGHRQISRHLAGLGHFLVTVFQGDEFPVAETCVGKQNEGEI